MSATDFDQIEYCFLAEDTEPEAVEVKICIPKLMGQMSMGNETTKTPVDKTAVMNDDGCGVKGSTETQNYIIAKMQDPYEHKHGHHDCQSKITGQDNCPNKTHNDSCGCTSHLKNCDHFHHDHHLPHKGQYGEMGRGGYVPKGTQMICVIMNRNIKDIIVLRAWCRWND